MKDLLKSYILLKEGKQLLSYARYIISSFDEMEQKMQQSAENSILKIGATVTIGTCILSQLHEEFINSDIEFIVERYGIKNQDRFWTCRRPCSQQ